MLPGVRQTSPAERPWGGSSVHAGLLNETSQLVSRDAELFKGNRGLFHSGLLSSLYCLGVPLIQAINNTRLKKHAPGDRSFRPWQGGNASLPRASLAFHRRTYPCSVLNYGVLCKVRKTVTATAYRTTPEHGDLKRLYKHLHSLQQKSMEQKSRNRKGKGENQ